MGGPILEFINIQPLKRGVCFQNSSICTIKPPKGGSASKIHQQTAPQNGVLFQNSSTCSHPKWGSPLEFINIQHPKRGSASRFHQPKRDSICNKKEGFASRDNFYGSSGTYFKLLTLIPLLRISIFCHFGRTSFVLPIRPKDGILNRDIRVWNSEVFKIRILKVNYFHLPIEEITQN